MTGGEQSAEKNTTIQRMRLLGNLAPIVPEIFILSVLQSCRLPKQLQKV